MTEGIEDLTPFFEDRCWMFVHLARKAHVGVILRRGPTQWWRVTLWDTRRDTFEGGQWFRGQLYPDKCDVSPDGKLFVYFGGKFSHRAEAKGYRTTWTAVSRPPYLTALALWPMGGTWGGDGVFLDDRTVRLSTTSPDYGAPHHPDHPPGPLRVLGFGALKKGDPWYEAVPSCQSGWRGMLAPTQPKHYTSYAAWRKTSGDLTLERETACEMDHPGGTVYHVERYPSRRRSLYTLYRPDGETAALFEAHWADWDQQGRLVATVGGRVLEGDLTRKNKLRWHQLASMHEERPTPLEAPTWAQHW
jgi:hypothetical protein